MFDGEILPEDMEMSEEVEMQNAELKEYISEMLLLISSGDETVDF